MIIDFRSKFAAIQREYSPSPRKFYGFCTSVTVSIYKSFIDIHYVMSTSISMSASMFVSSLLVPVSPFVCRKLRLRRVYLRVWGIWLYGNIWNDQDCYNYNLGFLFLRSFFLLLFSPHWHWHGHWFFTFFFVIFTSIFFYRH